MMLFGQGELILVFEEFKQLLKMLLLILKQIDAVSINLMLHQRIGVC